MEAFWLNMAKNKYHRRLRYLRLRLMRFRGDPHELALGMALGIFIGMTPTIPFQTVFAVALALPFKASKITAALGTWISNPATIYMTYKYAYKTGALLLGIEQVATILGPVVHAINQGDLMQIAAAIFRVGELGTAAFLLGGMILGALFAAPAYVIFLYVFRAVLSWRTSRRLTGAR